jgi:hypothetical protein
MIVTEGALNEQVGRGMQLAESEKWAPFCEGMENRWMKASMGQLLENTERYFASLSESTRTQLIGDFEKYAFPLVRAIFPELITNQLVSVQPMQGPISLVFYLDFIYGTSKGSIVRGSKMFDSIGRGPDAHNYSSEVVEEEQLASQVATSSQVSNKVLAFSPIRPGTLRIVGSDSGDIVTDDGNGNLVGDIGSGTNTVNYVTGRVDVILTTGDGAEDLTATYEYDMENNANLPEVDLVMVQSPVTARPRKLKTNWSLESAFNLKTLHGLEAETELTSAVGSQIRFEIDREIVTRLAKIASAGQNFDAGSVGAESYSERKLAFVDTLVGHGNKIFSDTGRATATWMVCGVNVANVVEALPGFVRIPVSPMVKGPHKAGRLNGSWDIFKDPFGFLVSGGATKANNFIVGYKGSEFLEAGLVYAPYIPLYTTPLVVLDDFKARKGLATQYGVKVVNPKFYTSGFITNPEVTSV